MKKEKGFWMRTAKDVLERKLPFLLQRYKKRVTNAPKTITYSIHIPFNLQDDSNHITNCHTYETFKTNSYIKFIFCSVY